MASGAVIRLGREWDRKTGRAGKPVTFDLSSHFELLAPTRSGKGVSLEIPNLVLGLRGCSVLSIDPSGQNAAVCAEARRRIGNDVLCLNPYGLHVNRYPDLQSCGFNPLAGINPASTFFFQDCQAVGEALIKIEGNDPHWTQSARGLVTGIIMWEVLKAHRERRAPLLENVRAMMCEPERRDRDAPELTPEEEKLGGRISAGLRFHAAQMIASEHRQIGDLAGRFVKEGSREIDSVVSTARTQTEWLLSEPMCSDLCRNGIGDWAGLADRPTTVFVIVPAEFLESQEGSVWLRLVIMAALRALYGRAGSRRVETILFMLSEFAQLGKLAAIETARGQAGKYGVRLWPVLQDIHQLRTLYGQYGAESFAGQCGAVFAFAPGDWESAEWMSRRSGEENVKIPGMSQSEQGVTVSYHWQRQRCWSPDDIMSLPRFHGLVWFLGQSRAVPVYAEPYIDKHGNIRPEYQRAGARPDPYHSKGIDDVAGRLPASEHLPSGKLLAPPASSLGARRGFGKLIAKVIGSAAALIVAAGIASAWISSHDHPTAQHSAAKHAPR